MMNSNYAQGSKDTQKSVKILPKAETKALNLNQSSNTLPNVAVLKHSSGKSLSSGEISFNQKWAVTSAGLAPRVGLGPNASSRKKHTIELKRKPVKVKHEPIQPSKKKSKWEDKIIKSDIIDIEDMDIPSEVTMRVDDGDDWLYYTNVASEVIYEPLFNPNDYSTDWIDVRLSKKSGRKLFPRDTTRYIRMKGGKVKIPFKTSYSITSHDLSWKRALNSPVQCAKFVMKVIAPHEASQPMYGQKYTIEDLVQNLPAGYHIWLRTSPSTYEGFCNRGYVTYEMIIDSKVLIIENLSDRSHVWVGVKPNFSPMSLVRNPKSNNLLVLPNLEPGLDVKQVKISTASKGNETTCSFFGNDFRTVQAMIEEGNNILKTAGKADMDWEKVIEPSNLKKLAPVTCNAVGIDQSRHWARLWFGQNPFPYVTSNLQVRMILYKQLTSNYPSVMPYKPTGGFEDEVVKMRSGLKIIEQDVGYVKGTYTVDDKTKDYYVTNTFQDTLVADDDDEDDWIEECQVMLVECKNLLATAGLVAQWKGPVINWNHDNTPEFWKIYSKELKDLNCDFILPCKSACLPNPNIFEKDGSLKTNHMLIHKSGNSPIGAFTLSNGYNILGKGYPRSLQVGHYMPPNFTVPMSELFHLAHNEKTLTGPLNIWHSELKDKIKTIINVCNQVKVDLEYLSHDKICFILSDPDYLPSNGDYTKLKKYLDGLEGGYDGDGNDLEDRTNWAQQWKLQTMNKVYAKLPERYRPKADFPLPDFKDSVKFDLNSEKLPQSNNDNAANSTKDKKEKEEEEEIKDNYEDFFSQNMSKAKVIKRKGKKVMDKTKKKLIELVQTVRETFEQYLRTSKGRIVGWRAKLKNFVDRLVGLIISVIKNFDKSNIISSLIHLAQSFFKYMINPDPSKVPEMPKDMYACALCDANTSNIFTKTDEDLSVCNDCLELKTIDKCECSKQKHLRFSQCYDCADKDEECIMLKIGKIYNQTPLGFAIKDMVPLEILEKYELPEELTTKEKNEKLIAEMCAEESESGEKEEVEEPESKSIVEAPCIEVTTTPISPAPAVGPKPTPPGPAGPGPVTPTPTPKRRGPPKIPKDMKSDEVVEGFGPWIRQNWDYSSAAKAGTGFFTSLLRNVRNTLNSLDEDINFKVGDEKTAVFWCYREISRLKLNKSHRRPHTLSKIEMTVKEPTVICYEVLCGTGRVETMMGTSLIRNIISQRLVVCKEGLANLASTHPQIIRTESKLDASLALSVQNSNALNVINIDVEVALNTKQFYIIECCERLQRGVVNQLGNNNSPATG